MKLHPVLMLLLLGHVLGDFYFQSKDMAKNKNENWVCLIRHGIIYTFCMAAVLFGGVPFSCELLFIFLLTSVSHLVIDFSKRFVKWKKIFTVDQLLHLAFLIAAWRIWGNALTARGFVLYELDYLPKSLILVVLGLLTILRPVGVLIAQGDIWDFSKSKTPPSDSQQGAGKMIGYLERVIVFFLLLNGQYSAIAFVITAKSVARFPEIGKNGEGRSQAEYYLIGTLLSMTSVFIVTLLLGLIK